MKKFLLIITLILQMIFGFAQMQDYNIDSMIRLRKVDSLDGRVKTYYSKGSRDRAIKAQDIIQKAVVYYSDKYHKPFNAKLAILDSNQWVSDIVPWGFTFVNNGWAILNTGTNPESYLSVVAPNEKRAAFDSLLKTQNLKIEEFQFINDLVSTIHELGHHYLMKVRNISTSGMWFNEIGANYFAYNFFERMKLPHYHQVIPSLQFITTRTTPHYRELISWDTLNIKLPLEDFIWFDAKTQLLVEKIYSSKGEKFLDDLIKIFAGKKPEDLTLEYTITEINKLSGNLVIAWREELRQK